MAPGRNMYAALKGSRSSSFSVRPFTRAHIERPRSPLSVLLGDGSGFLTCVWFNQSYLERVFQRGQRLIVHGKVGRAMLRVAREGYPRPILEIPDINRL